MMMCTHACACCILNACEHYISACMAKGQILAHHLPLPWTWIGMNNARAYPRMYDRRWRSYNGVARRRTSSSALETMDVEQIRVKSPVSVMIQDDHDAFDWWPSSTTDTSKLGLDFGTTDLQAQLDQDPLAQTEIKRGSFRTENRSSECHCTDSIEWASEGLLQGFSTVLLMIGLRFI